MVASNASRIARLYRLIEVIGLAFLALCVALTAPGEASIWLHGGHATLEQEALHDYADAMGIIHHHGDDDPSDHLDAIPSPVRLSLVPHGPELTTATAVNLLPNDTVQSVVAHILLAVPIGFLPRLLCFLQLLIQSVYLPLPKLPPRLAPDPT